MDKAISAQDQEFMETYKTLSPENRKKVMIVVRWIKNASEAETKEFEKLVATKDKDAIDAFIESLRNKSTTSIVEVDIK